jgi:hypothetical protein
MLAIFLTVLKIIGIMLLCVIGFILLLLLIILFVPVRYSAKGSYKEKKPQIRLRVSYLLYLFCLIVSYNEKLDYYIRLFGIKIDLKKLKNKKKRPQVTSCEASADTDANDSSDKKDTTSDDKEQTSADEELGFFEKISSKKDKIEYYIDILTRDTTKEALLVCKDRIGKALKALLPYKGKIYARIGLENAGTTGKILGIYKALYDYIGDVVVFYPVFDSEVIDIEFNLKGRIRFVTVLYHFIRIYFDKNCHRLIKLFIKNNKKAKKTKESRKEKA